MEHSSQQATSARPSPGGCGRATCAQCPRIWAFDRARCIARLAARRARQARWACNGHSLGMEAVRAPASAARRGGRRARGRGVEWNRSR
eukprot:scaffold60571_cov30-Tisochrysis_lutea.AAC.2